MAEKDDRKELERRLEQARRMLAGVTDPLTMERLTRLVGELEEETVTVRPP